MLLYKMVRHFTCDRELANLIEKTNLLSYVIFNNTASYVCWYLQDESYGQLRLIQQWPTHKPLSETTVLMKNTKARVSI